MHYNNFTVVSSRKPINSLHAVRLYIGVRGTVSLCEAPIYRRSCTCSRVPALSEGEVPPS